MKIEPVATNRSRVIRYALIGSLLVHALLGLGFLVVEDQAPKESYVVDLIVNEATPPPPPPKPEATPEPKPKDVPPPNQETKPQPNAEPPKPVFGVTKESTIDGESGVSVRVGNTLMKEPEKNLTDPSQVKPYSGGDVFSQSELDKPPRVLKMIKPEYPLLAKRANRQGVVRVRFLVSKNGAVSNVKVLSAPVGLGFAEAAVAAVQQWKYETPTVKGRAVSAWIVQSIRFELE